ncbi:MAG: hypothetical protein J6T22_04250 [Bacteroidales bacterium]|nr:hypothetical protein [Bacteroidales bacterium]
MIVMLLFLFLWTGQPRAIGQTNTRSLDLFSGVDFNFRDINFNTQYEYLIRLTPGFKWNMGNHWQLSGQVLLPIINQYGENNKYVQLNILDLSKELRLGNLYLKASTGIFSMNSYGVDLKAFLPLCKWFAFEGQAGCVGTMILNPVWSINSMNRFVGTIGGDFYLSKWNTQFRGVIGRYYFQDFGCEVEAMRHFNHTTVSVYSRWSKLEGFDGGFRFVIALPPYQRKHRMVNFRPASNFRMSYTVMYHNFSNRMYRTDPEENERDGWFSRDLLQWGSHTMKPDFIIKK